MSQWDRPKDDTGKTKKLDTKSIPGEALIVNWRIAQWFPELPADVVAKLQRLHEDVLKINKTLSIIPVKTIPAADAIYFADSIIASKAIYASTTIDEIYDFGTGAGFPGLVFAILFPKCKVVLVEGNAKYAEFLTQCVKSLALTNVTVMARMVETLPQGSLKFAMARGFSNLTKTLLTARKLFVKGGRFYHLKGEEWASEVAAIPTQLCSFWAPSLLGEYKLPVGEIRFAVVRTEKIAD